MRNMGCLSVGMFVADCWQHYHDRREGVANPAVMCDAPQKREPTTTGEPMTSTRERVRQLTAQGLTVREIASILSLSTQAIYKHRKAIDAGDTADAA